MKALVTGGAGFLGAEVTHLLRSRGLDVLSLSRSESEGVTQCDLSDIVTVCQFLKQYSPDVIVNCAVTADFQNSNPDTFYPVNVLLPALLSGWSRDNNSYLCHISGTLIQGISATHIDNKTPIQIDCEYAQSKLLAEQLVQLSGAQASILRFGGIFGVQGPSHLSLNRVLRDAQDGSLPKVFANGNARRNYIHVHDAANVILQCIRTKITGIRWCAGSEVLSIAEMMSRICELYFPGTPPQYVPGEEALDQVVVPSADLDMGESFMKALEREL